MAEVIQSEVAHHAQVVTGRSGGHESGLSLRAYARHRKSMGLPGGSLASVQKAVKSGRIQLDADGLVDPASADASWEGGTDNTRGMGHAAPGGFIAGGQPAPNAPPDYATSRAIREAYAARTAKIEYERLAGSLVSTSQVEEESFQLGRSVREALLGIPSRLASLLAAEADPGKVETLITKEIRSALEMLAGADPSP